ncbi:PilZ domain-containing protein [Acidocella sp.]|uniref:PilZ domain-containing protein n=1 Tax=Acidocella sp. TaxID=50710 RepID=UPI003D01E9FE
MNEASDAVPLAAKPCLGHNVLRKGSEMLSGKSYPHSLKAGDAPQSSFADRRNTARTPVIKSAKLIVGEGYSRGIYNCLVLDESAGGVLIDLGTLFNLPDEVVFHMVGGAMRRAKRRWTAGSKVGLEFVGEHLVSAETTHDMAEIARLIRAQGLLAGVSALRARHFFKQNQLQEMAEAAEAAYIRLEAMLKGQ